MAAGGTRPPCQIRGRSWPLEARITTGPGACQPPNGRDPSRGPPFPAASRAALRRTSPKVGWAWGLEARSAAVHSRLIARAASLASSPAEAPRMWTPQEPAPAGPAVEPHPALDLAGGAGPAVGQVGGLPALEGDAEGLQPGRGASGRGHLGMEVHHFGIGEVADPCGAFRPGIRQGPCPPPRRGGPAWGPRWRSPMAEIEGTVLARSWSTFTAEPAPSSTPACSRPRSRVQGTRPMATRAREAHSSSPEPSLVLTSPERTDRSSTRTPVRSSSPCLERREAASSAIPLSISGRMPSADSTTVTDEPRRLQTLPSSRPTAPAPTTSRLSGTRSRRRASSLEMDPLAVEGSAGQGSGPAAGGDQDVPGLQDAVRARGRADAHRFRGLDPGRSLEDLDPAPGEERLHALGRSARRCAPCASSSPPGPARPGPPSPRALPARSGRGPAASWTPAGPCWECIRHGGRCRRGRCGGPRRPPRGPARRRAGPPPSRPARRRPPPGRTGPFRLRDPCGTP